MKKKKLGVGIIGLGRISPRHIEDSIKKIKELELKAVCDINRKLAKEIGVREGVRYYTDYHELLNDEEVNLVSVCTPNYLHFPMGLAIAKAGKVCVMEKPVAQNSKDAVKLVAAFTGSTKLFPVLQVRYNPAVQVLKKSVKKGILGKVYTGSLVIRWTRPQEYFDESDWKGSLKKDGGSLLTQAIHYIDVMQYVLGPVKGVFGKCSKVAHKIETEDIANAIIDFKSGARVNLEFTICTYPHNLECSLSVLGERGSIKIGGLAMNKCELWEVKDFPEPIIPEGLMPNVYSSGFYVGSCPNHYFVYRDIVDTIIYQKRPRLKIPGQEAIASLKIIDSIKKSSQTGKVVHL